MNPWLMFGLLLVVVVITWLAMAVWDDTVEPGIREWYDSETDTWHRV